MTKPVRLARQAREEVLEAARRYGEQRPELRAEFLAAVDDAVERVVRYAPHLGSPPGIDPTFGVKRVFMKRFPFSVFFIELPTRYRILAVAHGRRLPFYWRARQAVGTWPWRAMTMTGTRESVPTQLSLMSIDTGNAAVCAPLQPSRTRNSSAGYVTSGAIVIVPVLGSSVPRRGGP